MLKYVGVLDQWVYLGIVFLSLFFMLEYIGALDPWVYLVIIFLSLFLC